MKNKLFLSIIGIFGFCVLFNCILAANYRFYNTSAGKLRFELAGERHYDIDLTQSEYQKYIKPKVTAVDDGYVISDTNLKKAIIEMFKANVQAIDDEITDYAASIKYKVKVTAQYGSYEQSKQGLPMLDTDKLITKSNYSGADAHRVAVYYYTLSDYFGCSINRLLKAGNSIVSDISSFKKINIKIEDKIKVTPVINFQPTGSIRTEEKNNLSGTTKADIQKKIDNYVVKYNSQITTYNGLVDKYNYVIANCVKYTKPVTPPSSSSSSSSNSNSSSSTGNNSVASEYDSSKWWQSAFDFLEKGEASGSNMSTDIENLKSMKNLRELIFDIGNMIFIVVTAFLGGKYIWGGVDEKFSVKNSLLTLIVAAMVFYGWNAITNVLDVEELLTGSTASSGYENFAVTIYDAIMYVVNVAAIGGIIYLGVKYMMAGADGKAELKVKLVPVVMGVIMVYGTVNLIGFILDITVRAL